jgi:copper chaperone CopZ
MNKTDTLNITGMSCQMCVKHVTRALQNVNGVSDVTVSLEPGTATVTYNPELAGIEAFRSAVSEAGYAVAD